MTGQPPAPRSVHLRLDPPLLADVVALALDGAGIAVDAQGPADGVVVTNRAVAPLRASAVVRVVARRGQSGPVSEVDDRTHTVAATLDELVTALRRLL